MIDRPPRPLLSLSVGVSGHRFNKMPADQRGRVRQQLRAVLAGIEAACVACHEQGMPQYATAVPQVRLFSGLAEGTDQFAVEERPPHWQVAAILPFPRERYRQDFATATGEGISEAEKGFDACLALSTTVTELPGSHHVRERSPGALERRPASAYAELGAFLLRQIDILVAVWDGRPSSGAGGTAEMIAKALEGGIPVVAIASNDAERPPRLLLHHADMYAPAPFADALAGPIAAAVNRILALPAAAEGQKGAHGHDDTLPGLARLNLFLEERWQPKCRWTAYDWLKRGWKFWQWRFPLHAAQPHKDHLDWSDFIEAAPQGGGHTDRIRTILYPRYAIANNLATHFSHVYRSAYVMIYLLAVVAVAIALIGTLPSGDDHGDKLPALIHKAELVIAELVLVAIIIALVWVGRARRWHDRWVDYRALAEMLRHLRFLSLLGEYGGTRQSFQPLAHRGSDWVLWYLRATAREIGLPNAVLDAPYQDKALRATRDTEVAEQIAYNSNNAVTLDALHHKLHTLGDRCFFGTAAILILFLVALGIVLLPAGKTLFPGLIDLLYALKPGVTIAAAFLPALGAAFAGINFTGDFGGFARRSTQTAAGLTGLLAEYDRSIAEPDLESTTEVLLATARVMTEDISFWQSIYSHKRLTLPS